MTTVNYFHNLQSGAPQLDGLAGSLISVLDACLVTGWGLQTATISVAAGVATLTTPGLHVLEAHQVALVEGATPSGLNGRKRVLTRTSLSITFAAPGVPDGAATGSITVRLAPAGWAKVFSGTNRAVYRAPVTTEGSRQWLRVDDTFGRNARVVGYETMGDVDTGEGPFPTSAQLSGGGWWPKSNAASSAARAWTVIADDRTAYVHMGTAEATGVAGHIWGFGDFVSFKSGDAYGAFIASAVADISASTLAYSYGLEYAAVAGGASSAHVPRGFSGTGGAVAVGKTPESYFNGAANSGAGYGAVNTYPNGPNNGLLLSRKLLVEPGVCYRGIMRGLYLAPQNCHALFSRNALFDGSGDLAGRKVLPVKCGGAASTGSVGVVFFDITGPW